MNRTILFSVIMIAASSIPGFGRVFLVGSNPSLTILAFPQDIFKFQNDYGFYYITYENKPWWGDIDDPPNKPVNESPNRPNNTYLATGESYWPDNAGNTFKHKAIINAIQNQVGFGLTLRNMVKTRFDLRYSAWAMRNRASGAIGNTTFDYKERNGFHELYATGIAGVMVRDIPVGFKLGIGGVNTTYPDLEFTTNAAGVSTNRLYWGWSALQGANVFNTAKAVAHGEEQNQFSIGPTFEFDIQGGATLPRLCLGGRFRYHFGNLDTYNWSDLLDNYENDESNKIRNITGRLYGNKIWSEGEKYRFATLVLTRYTRMDSTEVVVANPELENGQVRQSRNFVFQINPNVSLYPWRTKQTYIDAAILCNYSFTGYSFRGPQWVGGGQKDSYVNTTTYASDEYAWQNCSYFRQNFFEVALDLNPVFPIYGNKDQSVAIGALLVLWTRFKWTNKYYGTNAIGTSDITFNVKNIRKNYDHESWLNSAFNLIYRRKGYIFRLDVGQPLIYSLTPRTRVTNAGGDSLLYEMRRENMWVSQSGVKLGFFVTTSLENLHGLFESILKKDYNTR
jgi:hypothetical protein